MDANGVATVVAASTGLITAITALITAIRAKGTAKEAHDIGTKATKKAEITNATAAKLNDKVNGIADDVDTIKRNGVG